MLKNVNDLMMLSSTILLCNMEESGVVVDKSVDQELSCKNFNTQ